MMGDDIYETELDFYVADIRTKLGMIVKDIEKFEDKGNKAAGTRIRVNLMEIIKLCDKGRRHVLNVKKARESGM